MIRIVIITLALVILCASCGKKVPVRPPDDAVSGVAVEV